MVEEIVAQIISGSFGELIARTKSGSRIEIGDLLVSELEEQKMLFSVTDIFFGSQISHQNLEKISGLNLEGFESEEFADAEIRNYKLIKIKPLLELGKKNANHARTLPEFFSSLRNVKIHDLDFVSKSSNPLNIGMIRSGNKTLDIKVNIDGEKMLSHHLLIVGSTGRGKSVLMKNLIWEVTGSNYASMLILDPHDEYFGRKSLGLKDYPVKEKIVYYTTKDVPVGQRSLIINIKDIKPEHFDFLELSSPQRQLMYLFFKKFGNEWIKNLFVNDDVKIPSNEINEMSIAVLRRRLKLALDIDSDGETITFDGIFRDTQGESTISDITAFLEKGKTVIVDTSNFSSTAELLIGSMISSNILRKYKYYNMKGLLNEKPVVNIIIEEAPRVIGKDVLEKGSNIFGTIAREGRKFRIGISAITQLPSLIPRDILANLNTKFILGVEMGSERQAIIESAAQDLSDDSRAIASLDKGQAIVTSTFTKFAIPISIPFFDERIKDQRKVNTNFGGVKLN